MPATARKLVKKAEVDNDATRYASLLRMGRYVVLAMLILGPLVVNQPAHLFYNALDTGRRLFLYLGAGLLAALILRAWSLTRRISLRWHPVDVMVLLYVAGAVVSSLAGYSPRASFFGPLPTQDGLLLLWIGVCLYFGIKEFMRTTEEQELAAFVIGLVGGIVALIGLFDRFVTPHIGQQFALNVNFLGQRLVGTLGNSMFTGTYFAMTLPVAAGAMLATARLDRRLLLGGSVVLMLPSLLLTMARAAWVGFAFAVFFVLVLILIRWLKHRERIFGATAGAILLVILLVAGAGALYLGTGSSPSAGLNLRDRLRSVTNMESDTIKTRIVYMTTARNIFMAFPMWGVGYGNIKAVFPEYRPSSNVYESGLPLNRGYCTALPHDIVLEVAAQSGLIGIIPYLIMLGGIFTAGLLLMLRGNSWQAWISIGLLGGGAAYFITNLSAFDNAATLAQFWAIAGVLVALVAVERPLPARYGNLGRRLNDATVSCLNIVCLVVGLGAILGFVMQSAMALRMQDAINKLSRGERILDDVATAQTHDVSSEQALIMQARTLYTQAIAELNSVKALSPVPDAAPYEMSFLAWRAELTCTRPDEEPHVRAAMYKEAERALALHPRTPLVTRYYILDLMGQFDEHGDQTALERAVQLAKQLAKYEPKSAEVRVLLAQALQKLGDLTAAKLQADEAIALDSTLPDGFGLRGQILFHLGAQGGPQTSELMRASAADFEHVLKLGADLFPDDRLVYATTLLYLGETDRLIAEGRKLQGTGETFTGLCKAVAQFYIARKQPAEGERVLKALGAGMAKPVGSPLPSPAHQPSAPLGPAPAAVPAGPVMPGLPLAR